MSKAEALKGGVPRGTVLRTAFSIYARSFRVAPVASALSLATSVASGVIGGLTTSFVRDLTNDVATGHRDAVTRPIVSILVLAFVVLAFSVVASVARTPVEAKTAHAIEVELAKLMLSLPTLDAFERPDVLDRLTLLRQEQWVFSVYSQVSGWVIQVFTLLVTSALLLVHVSPWFLLLPLSAIPQLLLSPVSARLEKVWAEEHAAAIRQRNAAFDLATSAASACEVRTFGLGSRLAREYGDQEESLLRSLCRANDKASSLSVLGQPLPIVSYGTALLLVVHRVRLHEASVGDVTLVVTLAARVQNLMGQIGDIVATFNNTAGGISRLAWLRNYASRLTSSPGTDLPPSQLRQGISLRGVGFSYPSGEAALTGVTLDLPAGSTVALVGRNGAGKSTLVKLLLGLYEPTSGAVLVDGTDLRHLAPGTWREVSSGSFQDHVRLMLQTRSTVGVGDLEHLDDEAAVLLAAERGAAADVISNLADGLNTQLGREYGGAELSGGQWQKLALARGMMRADPLLLVLDEPTSALDPMTEAQLFGSYARRARETGRETGAITVLVSHRFSTVQGADLVVVVEGGTVTEVGSHDELMLTGGEYAALYAAQASSYL